MNCLSIIPSKVSISVSVCRKVCARSVSIPPILEHGDTDNWEDEDSIEVDSEKKQSRKRYLCYPSPLLLLFTVFCFCLVDFVESDDNLMVISGYGRRTMMPGGGPGGVALALSPGIGTSRGTAGSSSGTSLTPRRPAPSRAGGSRSERRATARRG